MVVRLNETYMFSKRIFHWWSSLSFYWNTQSGWHNQTVFCVSLSTSYLLSVDNKKREKNSNRAANKHLPSFAKRLMLSTHLIAINTWNFQQFIFYANETQQTIALHNHWPPYIYAILYFLLFIFQFAKYSLRENKM